MRILSGFLLKEGFFVLTLLMVVFIGNHLKAQQKEGNIKVNARIVDSTSNEGVPFATLSVSKLPENKIYRKLITREDGKFTIDVDTGLYKLQVYSLGYVQKDIDFSVKENSKEFDLGTITLSQSATNLEAVDIVAEKPLVTVEPDKISYNTESDPDSKTSNVLEMLRKVPLVSVDGEDNVQLKGSSNFKFYLNGKPSNMLSSNPKDFLKSLPASAVKNIEVITTPGAKYDAEGVNGIINIVTQKKSLNGYTCSVNFGANDLGDVNGGTYVAAALGKFVFSTNLYLSKYSQPWNEINSYRENDLSESMRYTESEGRSKNKGFFPWNSTELSYEIDSLNLISASFSFFEGNNESQSYSDYNVMAVDRSLTQSYQTINDFSYSYGDIGGNIDYQKTFKRNKEQLLTLSYKFSSSPYSNETKTTIDSILSFPSSKRITTNDAFDNEFTYQADYVQPLNKLGKIETGVKYIQRISASDAGGKLYMFDNEEFIEDKNAFNEFDYNQDIAATYVSYSKKIGDFGVNTGLRLENSITKGNFSKDESLDFKNESLEWVPSVGFSYQISKAQNVRLSYNKRIQRPMIWYLNPYVYDTDPKNISQGNPNLDAEHFQNFELNYSIFMKLGNINLSSSYSTSNNGIDRIVWVENEDVLHSSYENIAKIESFTENLYLNLRIGKKINFNSNLTAIYNDVSNNLDNSLENEGWGYRSYGRLQYTILESLKASVYGGYYKHAASLQSSYSGHDFNGINLSKTFLEDKLTLSVSVRDFLKEKKKWKSERWTDYVYQSSENYRTGRSFRFNISYRFGELNTSVKKAKRGIKNDDVKEGGDNNQGGGN